MRPQSGRTLAQGRWRAMVAVLCLASCLVPCSGWAGQGAAPLPAAQSKATANPAAKAVLSASTVPKPGTGQQNGTEPMPGATWTEQKTGMQFVWIPAGCFQMGSPPQEHGRNFDEGPQHKVCVSGYWMGKAEVTQGQWVTIMKMNPSLIDNGAEYPVDGVSWDMAKKFIKMLNAGTQGDLRLPTEAEWEYACRAGTTTAYAFGETLAHGQATFEKPYVLPNPPQRAKKKISRTRRKATAPPRALWPNMHTNSVASFQPNAFGLYDMHGNVWEWCEDVYSAVFYGHSAQQDPINIGKGSSRVLRGGSWITKADTLRSANRSRGWPDLRTAFYGLRLVRSTRQVPQPAAPSSAPQR